MSPLFIFMCSYDFTCNSSATSSFICSVNWNLLIYRIVLSIFTSHVFADNLVNELFATVELDNTFSITAVPKAIMQLLSVGSFIINKKHILFLTGNIRHHSIAPRFLLNVPNNLRIGFLAIKFSTCKRPKF